MAKAAKDSESEGSSDEGYEDSEESDGELGGFLASIGIKQKGGRYPVLSCNVAAAVRQHVIEGVLCEDVILDTGSDGHILPRSVIPVARQAKGLVHGMGNGTEVLGDNAWVPANGKFLISISKLDKRGCTVKIKEGLMRVWGPDKKPLLHGRLNDRDMYIYYMPTVTTHAGELTSLDDAVTTT